MKHKCLVIGAGFSKAIADLPITSEMIDRFKIVLQNQRSIGNKSRVDEGQKLLNFIDNLEKKYKENIGAHRSNKDGTYYTNIIKNFEGLCSYIDLNLASDGHAYYEINGIKKDLPSKPLFANCTSSKLRDIRTYIGNYLYYTLIEDTSNAVLLNSFYNKFIKECKGIVTFNYDLILEKFLYKKGKWVYTKRLTKN